MGPDSVSVQRYSYHFPTGNMELGIDALFCQGPHCAYGFPPNPAGTVTAVPWRVWVRGTLRLPLSVRGETLHVQETSPREVLVLSIPVLPWQTK